MVPTAHLVILTCQSLFICTTANRVPISSLVQDDTPIQKLDNFVYSWPIEPASTSQSGSEHGHVEEPCQPSQVPEPMVIEEPAAVSQSENQLYGHLESHNNVENQPVPEPTIEIIDDSDEETLPTVGVTVTKLKSQKTRKQQSIPLRNCLASAINAVSSALTSNGLTGDFAMANIRLKIKWDVLLETMLKYYEFILISVLKRIDNEQYIYEHVQKQDIEASLERVRSFLRTEKFYGKVGDSGRLLRVICGYASLEMRREEAIKECAIQYVKHALLLLPSVIPGIKFDESGNIVVIGKYFPSSVQEVMQVDGGSKKRDSSSQSSTTSQPAKKKRTISTSSSSSSTSVSSSSTSISGTSTSVSSSSTSSSSTSTSTSSTSTGTKIVRGEQTLHRKKSQRALMTQSNPVQARHAYNHIAPYLKLELLDRNRSVCICAIAIEKALRKLTKMAMEWPEEKELRKHPIHATYPVTIKFLQEANKRFEKNLEAPGNKYANHYLSILGIPDCKKMPANQAMKLLINWFAAIALALIPELDEISYNNDVLSLE